MKITKELYIKINELLQQKERLEEAIKDFENMQKGNFVLFDDSLVKMSRYFVCFLKDEEIIQIIINHLKQKLTSIKVELENLGYCD